MKKLLALAATLAIIGGIGFQPTFAASSKSRDTTVTMGEGPHEPTTDGALDSNGTKTDSSNKGNPDNTNCNDCGTSGPGNK
jgi:hypothetical protein